MKLAEALNLRSSLMKQIAELKRRLEDCVRIQEGEEPVDTAEELLKELEPKIEQLYRLVYQINLTNLQIKDEGKSITELLAERDALAGRIQILNGCLNRLTENNTRFRTDDIRYIRTVDPKVFRKKYDEASSQLRQINLRIQMLGWTNDLIEE